IIIRHVQGKIQGWRLGPRCQRCTFSSSQQALECAETAEPSLTCEEGVDQWKPGCIQFDLLFSRSSASSFCTRSLKRLIKERLHWCIVYFSFGTDPERYCIYRLADIKFLWQWVATCQRCANLYEWIIHGLI